MESLISRSKIHLIEEFKLNNSSIQNMKLSGFVVVAFAGNLDV
jgi:hypothetical protein